MEELEGEMKRKVKAREETTMKEHFLKTFRPSFTSFQQGGAPACDGRALSGSSVGDHLEDVVAAGVQSMQLDVIDPGVADHLHLQQAVSAGHLCSADTGVTQLRLSGAGTSWSS